jgi:broad specificity phosphatase PhoE
MRTAPIAYFARHGETPGNAAGTFRGPLDLPLNDEGKADAKNLGQWFTDKPLSAVYSSTKTRTKDTAEEVARPKGMKVQPVAAFDPINVGYLAGEPKDQHSKVMDYFEKYPNEKIPMGESLNEFRARTQPPIKSILTEGAHSKYPVLAVVHSSIIHELNHIVTGDHNQTLVKPGGVVAVYHHPKHGLALKAVLHPETTEEAPYHG